MTDNDNDQRMANCPPVSGTTGIAYTALLATAALASAADFTVSAPLSFSGAVDGSAAVEVGEGFFVCATDEDNVLRLYATHDGGQPKNLRFDLDAGVKRALGVTKIKECDLEGAARIGDLIYWIGSHGRNKNALEKKERQVLFATRLKGQGKDATLEMEGDVYTGLIDDLASHPAYTQFNLGDAAKLAPKEEGALNIESLVADGDKLLIGLRNPRAKGGEALLVPLLNPADTIKKGGRAQLGAPLLLQLGCSGFRDMAVWNGQYLILAGDHKDRFASGAGSSLLFSWTGSGDPKPLNVDLGDLNPEAIVVMGEGTAAGARVLILSDDGKYARQAGNSFRGVWLQSAKP